MVRGYIVVYLWHGERHRDMNVFDSWQEARDMLRLFKQDRYQAWIETV